MNEPMEERGLLGNPIDAIKGKVEEIKADVTRHVKIWLLRLMRDVAISHLIDIADPEEVALNKDVQAILKG